MELESALLKSIFLRIFALAFSIFPLTTANALVDLSAHWEGIWVADGTLFSIAAAIEKEEFRVVQLESLGFEWSSENGKIDGKVVTIEIKYAGVTGTIQAELVDPNTAVAFAATCLPNFMVVCMLSKNRQAVFRKVIENAKN